MITAGLVTPAPRTRESQCPQGARDHTLPRAASPLDHGWRREGTAALDDRRGDLFDPPHAHQHADRVGRRRELLPRVNDHSLPALSLPVMMVTLEEGRGASANPGVGTGAHGRQDARHDLERMPARTSTVASSEPRANRNGSPMSARRASPSRMTDDEIADLRLRRALDAVALADVHLLGGDGRRAAKVRKRVVRARHRLATEPRATHCDQAGVSGARAHQPHFPDAHARPGVVPGGRDAITGATTPRFHGFGWRVEDPPLTRSGPMTNARLWESAACFAGATRAGPWVWRRRRAKGPATKSGRAHANCHRRVI